MAQRWASRPPAQREFPMRCAAVEQPALEFFQQRGLALAPGKTCSFCFAGETLHLRDAKGKNMSGSKAMRDDMEPTVRRSNPIVWYAHSKITTSAHLNLRPTGSGCSVSLLFDYAWYGAQFVLVMPVDGDPESRPSNLRLENEYLDTLASLLLRTGP